MFPPVLFLAVKCNHLTGNSIARATVDERFTPDHPDRGDMLAAFIRHGLDKDQAECEVMLQM